MKGVAGTPDCRGGSQVRKRQLSSLEAWNSPDITAELEKISTGLIYKIESYCLQDFLFLHGKVLPYERSRRTSQMFL